MSKLLSQKITKRRINIFYTILMIFTGLFQFQAQTLGPITPGAKLDTVFDRFGKKYHLKNLRVDTTTRYSPFNRTIQLCSAGYFDLYFETGSGMEGSSQAELDRRAVICQVFSDISAFIPSPLTANNNHVNIWIRDVNNLTSNPTGFLGLATAFYSMPYNSTGGIVDNEIWKTIHTGFDSYAGISSPLILTGGSSGATYFHGQMGFNFSQPGTIDWQTNLTTSTITPGYYDLYSVALHEITHALGFASLINYNGNSKFGTSFNYYTRFDLFLKKGTNNLITNTGACNTLYDYHFNPALSNTVVAPGCTITPTPTFSGSSDITTCSLSITYSGSTNVPVYTPSCFEPPSSLSHFEDICQVASGFTTSCTSSPANNNLYYVMSNANGTGDCFVKRYLKPEERAVLCDIGYNVNTTYGSSGNHTFFNYGGTACPGINVSGQNDGITGGSYAYMAAAGATLNITGILSNDINTSTFSCLQDLNDPSAFLSITSGNLSSVITFSSNVTGTHLLRYIPISSTGQIGNITYIYVYILNNNCTPSACDLVNNGGAENSTCGYMYDATQVSCWDAFSGSPDVYSNTCSNPGFNTSIDVPIHVGASNNTSYVGLASNNGYTEALQIILSSSLIPNQQYLLSFWASESTFGINNYTVHPIQFTSLPGVMPPVNINQPLTNMITTAVNLTSNLTIPDDNSWHYFSIPFTFTGTVNNNVLVVYNDALSFPGGKWSYIEIDDISIKPLSQTVFLDLPAIVCNTVTLNDLSAYLSSPAPGGFFSGQGVSQSSGIYSFSALAAGTGTFNIAYTFTNTAGCQVTIADNITVSNGSSFSVTASSSNSLVCSGKTVTLTATGASSYTWQPGNMTGSSVTVSPSSSTSYTLTGSICTNTAQTIVTVSVSPSPTLNIVANPSSICVGQTSTLTASGATTYSWNTGTTTSTLAVSPTVTTAYSVTGTNSVGCSFTKTISVLVGPVTPTVTATSSSVSVCGGGTATLTAIGAINFTWTPIGVYTSTASVTPTTAIVYTLSGSSGVGCNTATTTLLVNPIISTLCCTAANSTITTSTITPGVYTAATIIDVSGVITFTGNTSYTGYTFRMKPGAKLRVVGEYSLTLTNCKLYSCSELWDGIYLEGWNNDVHGHLVLNNTTVEDMYNGIVVEGNNWPVLVPTTGALINSTGSSLNKNYVSIQFRNIDGTVAGPGLTYTSTPYPFSMKTTTITSYSSSTSPGSTLKPSSTYTYAYNTWTGGASSSTNTPFVNFPRTFKGIVLNNMRALAPIVIGDSVNSGNTNIFDNMDFGIHGTEATAKVHNNYFKNITGSRKQTSNGETYPAFGPDEIGIAVAMTHTSTNIHSLTVGTHTVVPSSTPYPKGNKFEDCNRGIYAVGCLNTYAKANTFSATVTSTVPPYGVDAYYYYKNQSAIYTTAQADLFTLSYNYIRNFSSGIYSSHTTTNTSMRPSITKNDISAPLSTGFCLQAIQAVQVGGSNFTNGYVNIDGNAITNVYNGIIVGGIANGVLIKNNGVTVQDKAKLLGTTSTAINTAIKVANSNYAIVQANTVSNTGAVPTTSTNANYVTGIWVSGSTNTKVECNTAYHTGRCFVFQGACGSSSWKVNAMSDSYRGLEMQLSAVIGPQGAPTYTGTPNLSANTWTTLTQHTFVLGTTNVNTMSKLYLLSGGNTQPTLNFGTSAYSTIAGGINTPTGTSYTCNAGNAQRLANSGGNTNGNNNQKTAGTSGDSLTELTNLVTADEDSYDVFAEEMMYQNKQYVYELIEQDSINPANGSTLSSFYNINQNSAIDKLTEAQIAIGNFDISAALAANSSAPVLTAIEQKQQRANELVLKYMNDRNYAFTDAEKFELRNMANECLVKGDYVTHARNLVDVFTHSTILYEDECEAEANASRKKKMTTDAVNRAFNLYPNPNNGVMQLDYDLGYDNEATMKLFDVTGKLINTYTLQNNKGTIGINERNLTNGIYFYSILVKEKIIKNDKIVIIK